MREQERWMKKVLTGINTTLGLGVFFYRPFVFMMLFNWFVADVFNLSLINYWTAFGMTLLVLVFKRSPTKWLFMKESEIDEKESRRVSLIRSLVFMMVLTIVS